MEVLNEQTIKGYELKECLGEGAYGAVYRAFQPQVGREVAIKVILPEFANRPDFIRRFETEAQLVAQLEHMNIVPLYDYWREPDGAYLVMRLMKGGSLADSLRERGPWEPLEAVRLVDQVAAALQAAHQQGVVHRDLKPANILLDESGNAYLSDFGIAKELGTEVGLTQTGAIVGTPAYITPEQVQSQAVTPQTDIYALGVVLYELLTGDHPFAEAPTGALIIKHVSEPLPLARTRRSNLPTEVDEVIQKATAKDPASRFPDALTVAAEFRRALQLEVALPAVPEGEIYNPYKGLRAFQEADADDFFGREALTGQLLARLAPSPPVLSGNQTLPAEGSQGEGRGEGASRFLAVVGPSGSGKSSVVKAGLLPALRKGALPGSDQWFVIDIVPKSHPMEELDINLSRISANRNVNVAAQLERDARGLLRAGRMVLPTDDGDLLVVVDQFEELFTLVEDEAEARHFMDLIYTTVSDPDSQVHVIITLRADFYDRPLMYPDFSRLVEANTALVLPLTAEQLEQAIRAPAERVGVLFEKGLVPAITADVVDQPGALPLLQYALTELFERREGRMLTNRAYQSIGGVLGALGRRAEEIYASLEEQGKQSARQVFLRLVALGEGTEDTRRRVLQAELEGLSSGQRGADRGEGIGDNEQGAGISEVIDAFGRARLLTFDHDPATRGSTVEVAHEALLREWRRLREWLDESRADVRMQRVLGNATFEWREANQDNSFLLRGTRLAQFEDWARLDTVALTQDEHAYLEASIVARKARQTAEAERRQRELEQVSVGLASQALLEIEGSSPERSVLLALEALEHYPYTWQAERALGQAVLKNNLRQVLTHNGEIQTAAWSMDGTKILTGGMDGTVRIWDAQSGEELMHITKGAPVKASWSYDERFILAVNEEDLIVKVWDIETGEECFTLKEEDIGGKLDIYINGWEPWSPSVDRFLIYTLDGEITIWDAETGEMLQRLDGHQSSNQQAFWSPTGELIASSSTKDNTVIVWQVETGEVLHTVPGDFEEKFVQIGNWSPSGDYFTTRGAGGAKVYEASTGKQLLNLPVPGVWIWRLIWSPDGSRILTSGRQDGIAIVWDAENGQELFRIEKLERALGSDWSSDGDLLAVVGEDTNVHVWDPASEQEVLRLSRIPAINFGFVAFSPDGERILAFGENNQVRIYDLSSAFLTIKIPGSPEYMTNVAWSPSGEHIASSFFNDGTPMVWDSTSGEELFSLSGHEDYYYYLEWSPNGDRIVTGSFDKTAKIWDANTGEQLRTLIGHKEWVLSARWSPDGSRIVTGDASGKVIVWDAITGDDLLTFSAHQYYICNAVWSPDGARILSTSNDGIAVIWEADTGNVLLDLSPEEHQLQVGAADWTMDGKRVFIRDINGVFRIHDSETGEQLTQFSTPNNGVHMSLSPSDERLLIGGTACSVKVWNTETGAELLSYDVDGTYCDGAYSPDGSRVLIVSIDDKLQVFPTWHSAAELISYAKEHCVFRELTAEERELFGLPER